MDVDGRLFGCQDNEIFTRNDCCLCRIGHCGRWLRGQNLIAKFDKESWNAFVKDARSERLNYFEEM